MQSPTLQTLFPDDQNHTPRTVRSLISDFIKKSPHLEGYDPDTFLLVREIFSTFQGEAPLAGQRAIFVRLGGCNRGKKIGVGCQGCDTDFRVSHSEVKDIATLAHFIVSEIHHTFLNKGIKTPLIVFTGGEPLLQHKALFHTIRLISETLNNTDHGGIRVTYQLETNGDLLPLVNLEEHWLETKEPSDRHFSERIIYVVSPKMTPLPAKKIVSDDGVWINSNCLSDATVAWINRYPSANVFFRYVISNDPSSAHHYVPLTLLKMAKEAHRPAAGEHTGRLFLSPLTVWMAPGKRDMEACRLNTFRAVLLAEAHGLNLSFQSHVGAGIR